MQKRLSLILFLSLALCGCESELDLCPDDDVKVHPGVCGCGVPDDDSDDDGLMDCMDLCPNDGKKTAPGVCGCGILDVDEDGDGQMDCLQHQVDDLCPDDPAKTTPGVCGCGVPDVDADGDGREDCLGVFVDECPDDPAKTAPGVCGCGVADVDTDGDGAPDCIDECPNNASLQNSSFCGCDSTDSLEKVRDTDRDGVIDCLDACPLNPTKWENAGANGCDVFDSDGDGVDDPDDVCPNNPAIKEGSKDTDCERNGDGVIYIATAEDLLQLEEKLQAQYSKPEVGMPCPKGWIDTCSGTDKVIVCDSGVLQAVQCKTACTADATSKAGVCDSEIGVSGKNYLPIEKKALKIIIENNIDLGTVLENDGGETDCLNKGFKAISGLYNASLVSEKGAVIQFKKQGKRCKLTSPLFNQISFSEVKNITLDLDFVGGVQGALANTIETSNLSDVVVRGTIDALHSANPGDVMVWENIGGIAGRIGSMHYVVNTTRPNEPTLVSANLTNVVADGLTIESDAANVGGIAGNMLNVKLANPDRKHRVHKLSGMSEIGGVAGMMTGTNVMNVDSEVGTLKGEDGIGGVVGETSRVTMAGVHSRCDVASGITRIGGLVGNAVYTTADQIVSSVEIVEGDSEVGGLIGNANNVYGDRVESSVTGRVSGTINIGGLVGLGNYALAFDITSMLSGKAKLGFERVTNKVNSVEGVTNVGGAFGEIGININKLAEFTKEEIVQQERGFSLSVINNRVQRVSLMREGLAKSEVAGFAGQILVKGNPTVSEAHPEWDGLVRLENISNVATLRDMPSNDGFGGFVGYIVFDENQVALIRNIVTASQMFARAAVGGFASELSSPMAVGGFAGDVLPKEMYWFDAGLEGASALLGSETATGATEPNVKEVMYSPMKQDDVAKAVEALNASAKKWKVESVPFAGKTIELPVVTF